MFKKPGISLIPFSFIIAFHLIAILGIFTFSWKALAICLLLHFVTGCLGITLCFHRLLTHRSFKVPKWLEYFLSLCGSLALQGGPITWVAVHRQHHLHSDNDLDPHSPKHGFFWSHMEWTLRKVRGVETIDDKRKLAPDLANEFFYMATEGFGPLLNLGLGYLLYFLGGWSFVIWGIFVRLVLVYHSTWLVNSASHIWGYQSFKSNDTSRNNWFVALIAYGEGWHNNHHAFQTSAIHGLKHNEFDPTYFIISLFKKLGLATDIKVPSIYMLNLKNKNNS